MRSFLTATLCLAGALGAGHASAASPKVPEATRAAVLAALVECRKETVDATRLACFDKASASLDDAEKRGEVIVLDREAVRTAKREAFGLDLSALSLFKRGPASVTEQVDKVALVVDHGGQGPDGKWRFYTADGGPVWVQTDDEELRTPPHRGSELVVRKAAVGSFFCKIDGQRALRCQRQH